MLHDVRDGIAWLAGDEPFDNRNVFPLPDLIVSDLRMPSGDGLTLVRWARASEEFRDLPIIIHSGSYAPDHAGCIAAGATAAVEKEPLCGQLIEAVNLVSTGV